MNDNPITNQSMAFRKVINSVMANNFSGYRVVYVNKGRHALIMPDNEDNFTYYAIFKREFFMTFAKQFDEFSDANPDMAKIGESINEEYLDFAINRNVDYLLFIHPKNMYQVSPMLFKKFAEKFTLIRKQNRIRTYKHFKVNDGETTYSIPVNILDSFS